MIFCKYFLGAIQWHYFETKKGPFYALNCLCTASYATNYNVKMSGDSSLQSFSLALAGALTWGTLWTSTSSDKGIMKGQSMIFQICLR